jgi:hypothetical protein
VRGSEFDEIASSFMYKDKCRLESYIAEVRKEIHDMMR